MSFDYGFSSLSLYLIRDSLRLLIGFTSAMEEEKLYVFLLFKANFSSWILLWSANTPLRKKGRQETWTPLCTVKGLARPFLRTNLTFYQCLFWGACLNVCHCRDVVMHCKFKLCVQVKTMVILFFYWKTQW